MMPRNVVPPSATHVDILIIDDSLSDGELASIALENARPGVVSLHLQDSRAAVKYLLGIEEDRKLDHNSLFPISLVLLDLNMATMDGFEVLERIRRFEWGKQTPVVIFSSSDEASDRERCRTLGATDFVTKPASFSEFQEALKMICESRLGPPVLLDPRAMAAQ